MTFAYEHIQDVQAVRETFDKQSKDQLTSEWKTPKTLPFLGCSHPRGFIVLICIPTALCVQPSVFH